MTATKTKATTVRFDPYWWQTLGSSADKLGIAKAKFIHDATIDRIVVLRTLDQLAGDTIDRLLNDRIGELFRISDRRLQRVELQLARLVGSRR